MPVLISLLRGINVGGNKKIRMADLKDLYASLGFTNVHTLLQSGNVVFESESAAVDDIADQIESAIEERFGFVSRIMMRTAGEIESVIKSHPFTDEQIAEPSKILVMFLHEPPAEENVQQLRAAHQGPEIFHILGRELYAFYPDGMGRSKLDNVLIERKLKVRGTGRNWNTTHKLHELAQSMMQRT
jgi:uncharacterized protein (DUF1697 family)